MWRAGTTSPVVLDQRKKEDVFVGTVWGADILSLHGRQMPDKDMPQRGKIRYAR